jgi:hypothetical protein
VGGVELAALPPGSEMGVAGIPCCARIVGEYLLFSLFRQRWLRWRWSLWTCGMLFAILLANYWIADEIFPYVR